MAKAIAFASIGSHTSGLDDAESGHMPHEALRRVGRALLEACRPAWRPMLRSARRDPVALRARDEMQCSTPGIAMMGYAIDRADVQPTSADAIAEGKTSACALTLLRDRVMRPIGVPDEEWSIGYETTFVVDGLPLVATWGAAVIRPGPWHGSPGSCFAEETGTGRGSSMLTLSVGSLRTQARPGAAAWDGGQTPAERTRSSPGMRFSAAARATRWSSLFRAWA